MLSSFFKDGAIYTLPSIISRGLSFILIPLYTRALNPADYGSLDLFIIFNSIVSMTVALEISQGVARYYVSEINHMKKIIYFSSAFWFTVFCYGGFVALLFLFSQHLAEIIMGQAGLVFEFEIGIIYIFFHGIFYFVQNQLRWEMRSVDYALISLLMSFISAGASIWFAIFLGWNLAGLLIGMTLGVMVATVLGLWWLRSSLIFCVNRNQLMQMLSFSTPLVFSGVASWLSLYVDRIMINHFLSIEDVGIYAVGHRIALIASIAIVGFQGALTPLIYANYKNLNTPRQIEKIFRLFVLFALIIFLVLTLFSIDILKIMTIPDFYGASAVVIYLVPSILLSGMYIFSPGIGLAKKTYLIVVINIIGGLINILLNFWLIPLWGIQGAGFATMIGHASVFTLYLLIGQKFYYIPYKWVGIVIAICIATFFAIVLPQFQMTDKFRLAINLLALLLFGFLSVQIKLIKKHELIYASNFILKYARVRF